MGKLSLTSRRYCPTHRAFLGGTAGDRAHGPSAGSTRAAQAPAWTATAATAAEDCLAMVMTEEGFETGPAGLFFIFTSPEGWLTLKGHLLKCARHADRLLILTIYLHHRSVFLDEFKESHPTAAACLKLQKVLAVQRRWSNTAGAIELEPLELPSPGVAVTLRDLVSAAATYPGRERPWLADGRPATAMRLWDWPRLEEPALLAFERAWGDLHLQPPAWRCPAERVGAHLHQDVAPTALANRSQHLVLVEPTPDGVGCRWAPERLVQTLQGLVPSDALWGALGRDDNCTVVQSVEACGAGLSLNPYESILELLRSEGALPRHACTVVSACTGVGFALTAAARLYGSKLKVVGASECVDFKRRVCLDAYGPHGLTEANFATDSRTEPATQFRHAALFTVEPPCDAFAGCNRKRSRDSQAHSLLDIYRTLDYVRGRRPGAVVLEYVADSWATDAITQMVLRIAGYRWRGAVVCPTERGWPSARRRLYIVGNRLAGP